MNNVFEINFSNASPDVACVNCASVSAGGEPINKHAETINTGSSSIRSLRVRSSQRNNGKSIAGVMIILATTATNIVLLSPLLSLLTCVRAFVMFETPFVKNDWTLLTKLG